MVAVTRRAKTSEPIQERREELRTRVTFFLPAGERPHKQAVRATMRYLERQQTSALPVDGYTLSKRALPVFDGGCLAGTGDWENDPIVLFIVDYLCDVDDVRLDRSLRRLEQFILAEYGRRGKAQRTVWIVAQRVLVFA